MSTDIKDGMHPRNRFRTGYDFPRLIAESPALAEFVRTNAHGGEGIDFSDPHAVKALNRALLKNAYGLQGWDIPPGYLCPPIPGRCDHLHHLADLLAPRGGAGTRVLDIGTGANCIYPLIGACEHGWSFVGTDIDAVALRWARKNVAANPGVGGLIGLRLQKSPNRCFEGVIQPGETFGLTLCNPPFHASASEAAAAARRKLRNLRLPGTALNFGGKANELWCEGGEQAFIRRMIMESAGFAQRCGWFTTLVSKGEHLPSLEKTLRQVKAAQVRVVEMAQGQKKSRILAWTFRPHTGRERSRG